MMINPLDINEEASRTFVHHYVYPALVNLRHFLL